MRLSKLKQYREKLKLTIYKTLNRPVVTYESTSWLLNKELQKGKDCHHEKLRVPG